MEKIVFSRVRNASIDRAKGILIIFLVLHHIFCVATKNHNVDNIYFSVFGKIQYPLFVSYFMPSFFFITGLCSNFDCGYKEFCKKQFKTLILPALFFSFVFSLYPFDIQKSIKVLVSFFYGGGKYWFVLALFEAKIIYFFIRKLVHKKWLLILLLACLSWAGVICNCYLDSYPNVLVYRHAFSLTLFLAIGNIVKPYYSDKRIVLASVVIYAIVILIYSILGADLPYLTLKISCHPLSWPICFLLSVSGTIIILYVSRIMSACPLIQLIGKNTLCIYLTQIDCIMFLFNGFSDYFDNCSLFHVLISVTVFLITTISVGLLTSHLLNKSSLQFLLGKF